MLHTLLSFLLAQAAESIHRLPDISVTVCEQQIPSVYLLHCRTSIALRPLTERS